jgi:hypothetical protein
MDQRFIEEQHVVARYLADQLSDTDREAFELFCREHPEMFRELEATARFKSGLARLGESGQLDSLMAVRPGLGSFMLRHAAAIVAVGIGLAALGGALDAFRTPVIGATVAEVSGRFRTALPVVAEYELMRTRESGDFDARVILPSMPAALHFRVLPDVEGQPSYSATLSRDTASGTTVVASVSGLQPDAQQYVAFFISSAAMVPGTYSLRVAPEGDSTSGSTFTINFELRR